MFLSHVKSKGEIKLNENMKMQSTETCELDKKNARKYNFMASVILCQNHSVKQ